MKQFSSDKLLAHSRTDIILYTIPNNPGCKSAKAFLAKKGVKFEEADITQSAAALEELLKLSPSGVAPVLRQGEKTLAGFNDKQYSVFLSL